jgi:Cu+-exporting ATPase
MSRTIEVQVHGMHCGSCALLIDDALADLPGVLTSTTSTKRRRSTITHDPTRTDHTEILTTIHALGYRTEPITVS